MFEEWINEKFVAPLCKYYTPEATLLYGLIVAGAVFAIYKFFEKTKIKIDRNFFLAVLPFLIYGGWTRALRDHGLYEGWYFCSPPIYFVVFGVLLISLIVGQFIEKKFGLAYYKFVFAIGVLLIIYNAALTNITNWYAFFYVVGITSIFAIAFFLIHKFRPQWLSVVNAGIMTGHMLDATASFAAISLYGYYEQHVLPAFLIDLSGPWIMFPLKLLVVYPVLMYIDKHTEEKDIMFSNLLKIAILVLGLSLGIRNMLTISMLVI
jgi:uncharacterized membrane protein